MNNQDDLIWRKASGSTATGSDCVEVATEAGGGRAVRDSTRPGGPFLRVTAGAWGAFIGMVEGGGVAS